MNHRRRTFYRSLALAFGICAVFGSSAALSQAPQGQAPQGQAPQTADPRAEPANVEPKTEQSANNKPAGSETPEARKKPQDASHSNAALRRALGMGEEVSTAGEDPELPAGTLRVDVTDAQGQPVKGATVLLGVMAKGGDRKKQPTSTDGDGSALFKKLPTGEAQAYRVSVPYKGALYASTPFRLPAGSGYRVRIKRLDITRSPDAIFQSIGQTTIDFEKGRFIIVQRARLVNFGDTTYVFPKEGTLVPLPKDAMAFEAQKSMSDQSLSASEGGFRIRGSLPPGTADLLWKFDLKIEGTQADIVLPLVFNTFRYRVITAAPEGMKLKVKGFPEAQEVTLEGKPRLGTEIQRRPTDPALDAIRITLEGIPGPGPWRMIAVILLVLFLLAGAVWMQRGFKAQDSAPVKASKRSAVDSDAADSRATDKGSAHDETAAASSPAAQQLIEEAKALAAKRASGDIGPQYFKAESTRIRDELALVLAESRA